MKSLHFSDLFLIAAAFFLPLVAPANIVIFQHVISYSHRVTTWPLAEALTERGHKVTYITPYHPKQPNSNITELVPKKLTEFVDATLNSELDINLRVHKKMLPLSDLAFMLGELICKAVYDAEEFQIWLDEAVKNVNTSKKVDLFIIDNSAGLAECGAAIAYKLQAKQIIFDTLAVLAHEYDMFGLPPETTSVPELDDSLPEGRTMTFTERLNNALISLKWYWKHQEYYKKMDSYIRDTLDVQDMPYVEDLVKFKTSLVFYTGDFISDYARSLPPFYVNIAGIHAKSTKNPLPPKMAQFLNSTENDGFIYISLGSLVVSSNLPQSIKNVFFDTIKAFPKIKFLWKWNGDFPEKIPENLFLAKWFPQIDVLSQPNILGFVTQSGRPSTAEALYNGVPMISFPILGDQDYNSKSVNDMGANVKLEIGDATVEEFTKAVQKVAYDKGMRQRIRYIQRIYRDRPLSPKDAAVWWTEYVLRTENTDHLKPAGIHLNWYERRQIDIWATLSIAAFISIVGSLAILSLIVSKIYNHIESLDKTSSSKIKSS